MLLCKKIGTGKVQMLGGVLCCIGMTCTAFCKEAWQALLANGIVTGMFYTMSEKQLSENALANEYEPELTILTISL